jgi:hypothetical protein
MGDGHRMEMVQIVYHCYLYLWAILVLRKEAIETLCTDMSSMRSRGGCLALNIPPRTALSGWLLTI